MTILQYPDLRTSTGPVNHSYEQICFNKCIYFNNKKHAI